MADRVQTPVYNAGLANDPDVVVVGDTVIYSYLSADTIYTGGVSLLTGVLSYHMSNAVDTSYHILSDRVWVWYIDMQSNTHVVEFFVGDDGSLSIGRGRVFRNTYTAIYVQANVVEGAPPQAVVVDSGEMHSYLFEDPLSESTPLIATIAWDNGDFSVIYENRDLILAAYEKGDGNIEVSSNFLYFNVVYVSPFGHIVRTNAVVRGTTLTPPPLSAIPYVDGITWGGWDAEAVDVHEDMVITAKVRSVSGAILREIKENSVIVEVGFLNGHGFIHDDQMNLPLYISEEDHEIIRGQGKIKSIIGGLNNLNLLLEQQFLAGPTAGRPIGAPPGIEYFDTDLGYPVWWDGDTWSNKRR